MSASGAGGPEDEDQLGELEFLAKRDERDEEAAATLQPVGAERPDPEAVSPGGLQLDFGDAADDAPEELPPPDLDAAPAAPTPDPPFDPAADRRPDPSLAATEVQIDADDEPGPDGEPSKLAQARVAARRASELEDEAYKELWRRVLLAPFRGGGLLGMLSMGLIMALTAWLEGGVDQDARSLHSVLQAGLFVGSMALLGIYARRFIVCTYPRERVMPWFVDEEDQQGWFGAATGFITLVVVLCFPLMIFRGWVSWSQPAPWIGWVGTVVLAVAAAAQLPLALVAVVVKDTVLAALPTTVIRLWRREPRASRIAAGGAIAFAGLFVLSMVLSAVFNPDRADAVMSLEEDLSGSRQALRVLVFVVRLLGVYAAFVSFRVAGLLVRDVPEMKEVLE